MLSKNKFVLLHFSKHSHEARTNKEMKNNICFGYSNVIIYENAILHSKV